MHVYTRGTVASAQEKPAPEGGQGRGLDAGGQPSDSYQEQTRKSGSFGMWHHPQAYVSNFFLRWMQKCYFGIMELVICFLWQRAGGVHSPSRPGRY